MATSHHILVVDDEEDIRSMVMQALGRISGYEVVQAGSKKAAIDQLEHRRFDLVLTDLSMEHASAGVELLQDIKQRWPDTIVILLTGYATLDSAIAALRLGAENYLIKPSSVRELRESVLGALERRAETIRQRHMLAHIASTLQALSAPPGPTPLPAEPVAATERYLTIGNLRLDLHTYQATVDGDLLDLTPTEFAIMRTLSEAQGRTLSFDEIVAEVHGYQAERDEARHLLASHIRNLRRKLGASADYLHNVRGVGYYLAER
jgi:two-component system, OmpR family, response regulator